MPWSGWPLARIVTVFVGLAFILIGIQVIFFHYRQNFRHWAMWGPVILSPIVGVLALVMSVFNISGLQTIIAVLYAIAVISGLVGFYFHFTGVGNRVDGYKLQNFLVGPPIILPPLLSALGILGLLAFYWGGVG